MIKIQEFFLKFLPLLVILAFATLQFFLILRHKTPYLSDSYFYKHKFYLLQGNSQQEAFQRIQDQIPLEKADDISKNIFTNYEAYKNSYSFFSKRPLYPFSAFLLNSFLDNEYFAFLIPVFIAYIGLIILAFYLAKIVLPYFYAILTTSLLVAFYPFLDYSTYFLTDTTGAFFWFLLIFGSYKYIISKPNKKNWLIIYTIIFSISFLNREQIILLVLLWLIFYLLLVKFKFPKSSKFKCLKLFSISLVISSLYLVVSLVLNQRTIWDAISYTQNSYGLYEVRHTPIESLRYLGSSVVNSHLAIARDLSRHHWWFVFTFIGVAGALKFLLLQKEKNLVDVLIFASMISSYLFIFIFPDFSYRYYYPLIIGIIYFFSKTVSDYFKIEKI